jgi:uncharacterized protein
MILDLRAFEEFPVEAAIRAGPGEFAPFDDSVVRVDGVVANLAIQKSAEEYYCQARVKARVALECARCLCEFETELSGETDFVVCAEQAAKEYADGDAEEYVCFLGNELRADVVEPVRQALVSSLSMKPLCSEDCLGLCPSCGVNLNRKTCDCKNETTDPRWDGLKDLSPDELEAE